VTVRYERCADFVHELLHLACVLLGAGKVRPLNGLAVR
jgi:hypothetical protein